MPIILDCKPLLNDWFPGSFPKLPCRADPIPPSPGFLKTQEAADHVRVHADTLRRWVKLGVFPHIPLPGGGSDYRFSVAMIEEWARARALGMPGSPEPSKKGAERASERPYAVPKNRV